MRRSLFERSLLIGLAFLLLAGMAGLSQATELAVGAKVAPIEATASDGESYASSQVLSGDKRLVLIFFRGAW